MNDETRPIQPQANPQSGYWQPPGYADPAPMPDTLKPLPDTLKPVLYDQQKADAAAAAYPQAAYPQGVTPAASISYDPNAALRQAAEKRVKAREKFRSELSGGLSAVAINMIIWLVISVLAGGPIFFWPIFVIMGVGIGIVSSYSKAYGPQPMSEAEREQQIQAEIQRMSGGSQSPRR